MTALQIAVRFFTYPLGVFNHLLTATQNFSFYYTMFALAVAFRLLIVPIIGQEIRGRGSDTVKKHRNNPDNRKRG